MSASKTPARYIREDVFGIKCQRVFGDLLDYSQAQISRFENGERRLSAEAQERIRAAAKRRKIEWDNRWFFEVPPSRKVA